MKQKYCVMSVKRYIWNFKKKLMEVIVYRKKL